ncbi:MAG TPA: protein phosphatase CheZ [Nitrospirota bacterium]|nr:protein phosphatase CheZ [Nitrospirota bacterium]
MEQYIGFHLHTGEYGIPITRVREIINLPEITQIPQSPPYLRGITNLRGSVIPVVNLKHLIRVKDDGTGGRKVIVIASGRITFGLLVDGISGVISIDEAAIESPENLTQGHSDQVQGVAKLDGRLVVLLDIKKLIPLDDMSLLEDMAAEVSDAGADGARSVTRSVQTMGGEVRIRELLEARSSYEKTMRVAENDPRQEILNDIMCFMTAVSEQNYETADAAIQTIVKNGHGDLFKEVGKITRKLHDSIKSFREAVDPRLKDITRAEIPNAVDKLQFVIEKTEEAANKTMSVVEKYILRMDDLSGHIRKVQGPPETIEYLKVFKNGLEDDFTEILTTQSFQDLTGQTIKKVITLVNDIEGELVRLVTSFGVKIEPGSKEPAAAAEKVSQSDVDDLLKELGF